MGNPKSFLNQEFDGIFLVMKYAPGSFSKNFAWHGTGLRKLHTVINAGYSNTLSSVDRDLFRADCGLTGTLDLIPINFFLHNKNGQMSVDELVYQAIERPHTIRFDRLALFAFHLNRVGTGTRVVERPAMWANEFVREQLWADGAWQTSALADISIDPFMAGRMNAQSNVRVKCRNNYRHMFKLCSFLPSPLPVINSGAEQWIATALFLAWDRHILDGGAADKVELIDLIQSEEIYKLLGVSEDYAIENAGNLAEFYLKVGNLARFSGPFPLPESPKVPEETGTAWIDQEESDNGIVDADNGPWPSVIATQIDPAPDEPSARREVIDRLDALEEAVRELSEQPAMMGHNNPPEPLEDFPITRADSSTLQVIIIEVRRETEAETPNSVQLRADASGIQWIASRLGQWMKLRLDKGADAFVTTLGVGLAAGITSFYDKLVMAWQAISNWIETLTQLL